MEFGGPSFVITIVALSMAAWVITTFIRAKFGYPLSDDCGKMVHRSAEDPAARSLVAENAQLKATVGKLEDRIKVLERIATDPSRRLSHEIEELR